LMMRGQALFRWKIFEELHKSWEKMLLKYNLKNWLLALILIMTAWLVRKSFMWFLLAKSRIDPSSFIYLNLITFFKSLYSIRLNIIMVYFLNWNDDQPNPE
jgi:hypothetical protein